MLVSNIYQHFTKKCWLSQGKLLAEDKIMTGTDCPHTTVLCEDQLSVYLHSGVITVFERGGQNSWLAYNETEKPLFNNITDYSRYITLQITITFLSR